jgi:hypothetical protein
VLGTAEAQREGSGIFPGYTQDIRISDAANVVVAVPPGFIIKDFDPGIKSIVQIEKKSDVLFSIRAVNGPSWPPTKKINLTIYVDKGLFNVHLIFDRRDEEYYYKLNEKAAILVEYDSSQMADNDDQNINQGPGIDSNGAISEALIAIQSGKLQFDPAFKNYTLAEKLDYFIRDRMGVGLNMKGLKCYVNNIVSTENETYVSIKVENNSQAAFQPSLIQLFISSKSAGGKETLDSGPEPLVYDPVNTFKEKVLPQESAVYILQFNLITLGKNNRLEVIVRGEGKRSMNFFIKKNEYYRNLKYMPGIVYTDGDNRNK